MYLLVFRVQTILSSSENLQRAVPELLIFIWREIIVPSFLKKIYGYLRVLIFLLGKSTVILEE